MNLLIISHTPHYTRNNQFVGWGPTIREIDYLATLFERVVHLAPLHEELAPASMLPYQHTNITFTPVKPAGGERLVEKLGILWRIPHWLRAIRKAMLNADVIHIRCPAGISLVGLLAARYWSKGKPVWAKYAGNWQPEGNEPSTYRLQRWLLMKNWHQGMVTINGRWPGQPKHILTFNNPSMTQEEYHQASQSAQSKTLSLPVKLLFVGRIDKAKGVDRLLEIAVALNKQDLDFELTLVGDSADRETFESFVAENNLSKQVHFSGWQPITALNAFYHSAHLFVFPSTSEGWPKVLSEALAHGVVPIVSAISSIPEKLSGIGVGKVLPPDDLQGFVDAIVFYVNNPQAWQAESARCAKAGAGYTYQTYLQAVINAFNQFWQIELNSE